MGWDLAHAAGNVPLHLHEWDVDFAVWCHYKYVNAGPGAVGGCFVHERHGTDPEVLRPGGWWGHDQASRFAMPFAFDPVQGVEGWQVSNPPILAMAPVRVSLEVFAEVGMDALRAASVRLTGFLERLLDAVASGRKLEVITPREPDQPRRPAQRDGRRRRCGHRGPVRTASRAGRRSTAERRPAGAGTPVQHLRGLLAHGHRPRCGPALTRRGPPAITTSVVDPAWSSCGDGRRVRHRASACHADPMDPVDTVRRYAEAWKANDIATVLAMYHEDFVLHYFGESPLAGDHVGRDAAIATLMEATTRSRRQLDAIEDVLGGDTYAAIIAREGVGEPLRVVRRVFLYTVRDSKLAECWLFDEDQRFVDRLWSAPPEST